MLTPHRVSVFHVYTSQSYILLPLWHSINSCIIFTIEVRKNPLEGRREGGKEVFKWRTLGLYRRWHGRRFPWQRRRQLRLRRRRCWGSRRRRWPRGGPWHCSTSPEGRSAGGRRPDGSAASSRCRRCGGWAARLSAECRQEGRKRKRSEMIKTGTTMQFHSTTRSMLSSLFHMAT